MTAAIVIVSYRTPNDTAEAVSSSLVSGAHEVVVIDNASEDDTVDRLSEIGDQRLSVFANVRNVGFGTAANSGARASTGDALVFLNSDAQLTTQSLDLLLAELQQCHGRAIVGPRLIGMNGALQRSAGLVPMPFDLAIRALGLHTIATLMSRLPVVGPLLADSQTAREYATAVAASGSTGTTMVSGACLVVGREAFNELHGFDERFFMYFEDADLCRRAAAAGMPIRYVPSAVVSHIGGASSSEDYHFGPLHARSMRLYLGKWYGPGGSLLAVVLLWLRAFGFSIALRPGAKRAWRALWAAIRDEDPRR